MFDKFFRLSVIVGALPVTLTNGTVADATQVMADLNWLVNQVNANAAPLANTALLNANNNFTVVQSGVAATSGANFPISSQVQNQNFNTLSSTLGTNTITARIAALPLTAYATGQVFRWVPAQTNTGAASITVDSAGSVNIFNMGSALIGGEMRTGVAVEAYHDGTRLQLLTPGGFLPRTGGALGGNLDFSVGAVNYSAQVTVGFGSTVNIGAAASNNVLITGAGGTVSSFGVAPSGVRRFVEANPGGFVIAANGSTNPISGAAITTQGGDNFEMLSLGGGTWIMQAYDRFGGFPLTMSPITNSLSGDVALSNTGTFFDGPSVAQGTAGSWFVSGTVTCTDSGGIAVFHVKLWDGTTVIASTDCTNRAANIGATASLSGFLASPAGNLRISVEDSSATTGKILFNVSGSSKDSTITAVRIG